jgi:hypothetical protein
MLFKRTEQAKHSIIHDDIYLKFFRKRSPWNAREMYVSKVMFGDPYLLMVLSPS